MTKLPETIQDAWNNRKGPVVFSTVSPENVPNAIYATCVHLYDDHTILIADNYFSKTRKNISKGCIGSILFITEDKKAYQLKGSIQFHIRGEYFENMKTWNPEHLPGRAVAILKVDEAWSGAKKL